MVGPGFSSVPGKLVSQILRGTFIDLSELLSANLVSSDPEPHLILDGCLVLTAPPKKQWRQIEDITSWKPLRFSRSFSRHRSRSVGKTSRCTSS